MSVKSCPVSSVNASRRTMSPHEKDHARVGRRRLLAALVVGGLSFIGGDERAAAAGGARAGKDARAKAGGPSGKLTRLEHGPLGVTFAFSLEHAPFPMEGTPYKDDTVLVFVPRHYRVPPSGKLDAVVHFHGHNNMAAGAMDEHALREQLVESKQNALLVVPQGPVRAADSSGGKVEQRGGLRRLLEELTHELASPSVGKVLGPASLRGAKRFGTLCLSAHSGGYRVAAACLSQGEVEVTEVYLFDALYGATAAFRAWLKGGATGRRAPRRKLVSTYATSQVRAQNLSLIAELRSDGIDVLHEERPGALSRSELTRGRAIFLASPLDHGGVTHRHNNLRDCLYASQLRRHQKSDWFERRDGARPIEARGRGDERRATRGDSSP